MNDRATPNKERFEDLLVDRATVGLTETEHQELVDLGRELGLKVDGSVDLAAAAVDSCVSLEQNIELPEHLKDAVIQSAGLFQAGGVAKAISAVSGASAASPASAIAPVQTRSKIEDSELTFRRRDLIGLLAIGASLLLAAIAWQHRPAAKSPTELTVAEQRTQILNANPADLFQIEWSATDPKSNITGDVVWSDQDQEGYMSFRGLPKNDPTVEQYQLWIFDKSRSDAHPVDGGVFDIDSASGETIVPIDAKITVDQAVMFAVTVERPEGVVVSDRSRLPLLAKIE